MRYTPFLDSIGVKFKDEPDVDNLINIIDSCLEFVNRGINWGEYQGKKRKPCPEQPLLLTGQPIGQYHCPVCLDMQLAAMPHMPPDDDYEETIGPWPPGYVD